MKGSKLQFADLDDEDFEELDMELEQGELCPVCNVNHVRPGEKLCDNCKRLQEFDEEGEVDIDKDEEWKNYLEEDDGDLTVDDEALQEEIDEEFADDEEEEEYNDDELLDDDDIDPLSDLDDEDLDDDEDFDDDDEDDDDDDF